MTRGVLVVTRRGLVVTTAGVVVTASWLLAQSPWIAYSNLSRSKRSSQLLQACLRRLPGGAALTADLITTLRFDLFAFLKCASSQESLKFFRHHESGGELCKGGS